MTDFNEKQEVQKVGFYLRWFLSALAIAFVLNKLVGFVQGLF